MTPLGALHRSGQRARRVLPPQRLDRHSEHLVSTLLLVVQRERLFTTARRHFMHDPEVYKDPMVFNPDCLVAQPGKPAETDPFDVAFGYGRR